MTPKSFNQNSEIEAKVIQFLSYRRSVWQYEWNDLVNQNRDNSVGLLHAIFNACQTNNSEYAVSILGLLGDIEHPTTPNTPNPCVDLGAKIMTVCLEGKQMESARLLLTLDNVLWKGGNAWVLSAAARFFSQSHPDAMDEFFKRPVYRAANEAINQFDCGLMYEIAQIKPHVLPDNIQVKWKLDWLFSMQKPKSLTYGAELLTHLVNAGIELDTPVYEGRSLLELCGAKCIDYGHTSMKMAADCLLLAGAQYENLNREGWNDDFCAWLDRHPVVMRKALTDVVQSTHSSPGAPKPRLF